MIIPSNFSCLLSFDRRMVGLKDNNNQVILIGTDEVGRGCLAGPVVATAIVLPDIKDTDQLMTELAELNDSKKLSAQTRERLSKVLRDCAYWEVAESSVEEIDKINILNASFLAMRRAIDKLISKIKEKEFLVIVDGNKPIPNLPYEQKTLIKGDALSASIAASSVIAKVYRDALMCELACEYPHYAWQENKGYGSLKHRQAIAKIGLSPHHRRSFCRKFIDNIAVTKK